MVNIETPSSVPMTKKEQQLRQWKNREKELYITNARSHVLKKQITEAYEILENIRFDFLSDTAFREKIVAAKRGLEWALGDFLLSDSYHLLKRNEHAKLSPEEYDLLLKTPTIQEQCEVK